MKRQEKLEKWINTLDNEQKNRIILELLDYSIDSEYINFYDEDESPYFDGDGTRLDEL